MPEAPTNSVAATPAELGALVRKHRKARRITLETASALGGVGTRFLSEFERGKPTAEIGKVMAALATLGLELVVQRRGRGVAPAAIPRPMSGSSSKALDGE